MTPFPNGAQAIKRVTPFSQTQFTVENRISKSGGWEVFLKYFSTLNSIFPLHRRLILDTVLYLFSGTL